MHQEYRLYADFLLPLQVILGVTVGVAQVFGQSLVEQHELSIVNHLILLNEHDYSLGSVDQRQVLLVDAHYVRHE